MFKKHKQKRNFRLRMQDTMSVFCILYYIIHYVYTLCIFHINDDSRYLPLHTHNVKCYEMIYVNILVFLSKLY